MSENTDVHPLLKQAQVAAAEIKTDKIGAYNTGALAADRRVQEIVGYLKSGDEEKIQKANSLIDRFRKEWKKTSGTERASGTAGAILTRLQAQGIIEELF